MYRFIMRVCVSVCVFMCVGKEITVRYSERKSRHFEYSRHFECLESRQRKLGVTWQPIIGDLTDHACALFYWVAQASGFCFCWDRIT